MKRLRLAAAHEGHALRTFASRAVFSPTYTPPEKMIPTFFALALDQEQQNTLKRYVGFDNDEKCFILAYENEARYPGEVIKLKSFEVQGVARHVIKAL